MNHILQQYNRTKLASNVFEICYISIFFFLFLLLEDYKESLIGEYCENIMFEERCELIIKEILHPTFSSLSASATGSKLHKVYSIRTMTSVVSHLSLPTRYREDSTEYHCNIGKDINKD